MRRAKLGRFSKKFSRRFKPRFWRWRFGGSLCVKKKKDERIFIPHPLSFIPQTSRLDDRGVDWRKATEGLVFFEEDGADFDLFGISGRGWFDVENSGTAHQRRG